MQQCPNCGYSNRPGVILCDNCGASLIGKMPVDTKSLEASSEEEKAEIGVDASVLTDVKVQGVSEIGTSDVLKLEIEGGPEPIVVEPKAEAIFGRRDPATGAMPDIDLTPFAGYRMGVSRRHAAIRQNDEQSLDVWDLGSSNGTFLNGQKLSAHRPYRLHDGDELRLGQMMIRVTFETMTKSTAVPVESEKTPAPQPTPTTKPAVSKPAVTEEIMVSASVASGAEQPAKSTLPMDSSDVKPAVESPTPPAVESKSDAASVPAAPTPADAAPSVDSEPKPEAEQKSDEEKAAVSASDAKPPTEPAKAEVKPPVEAPEAPAEAAKAEAGSSAKAVEAPAAKATAEPEPTAEFKKPAEVEAKAEEKAADKTEDKAENKPTDKKRD